MSQLDSECDNYVYIPLTFGTAFITAVVGTILGQCGSFTVSNTVTKPNPRFDTTDKPGTEMC